MGIDNRSPKHMGCVKLLARNVQNSKRGRRRFSAGRSCVPGSRSGRVPPLVEAAVPVRRYQPLSGRPAGSACGAVVEAVSELALRAAVGRVASGIIASPPHPPAIPARTVLAPPLRRWPFQRPPCFFACVTRPGCPAGQRFVGARFPASARHPATHRPCTVLSGKYGLCTPCTTRRLLRAILPTRNGLASDRARAMARCRTNARQCRRARASVMLKRFGLASRAFCHWCVCVANRCSASLFHARIRH